MKREKGIRAAGAGREGGAASRHKKPLPLVEVEVEREREKEAATESIFLFCSSASFFFSRVSVFFFLLRPRLLALGAVGGGAESLPQDAERGLRRRGRGGSDAKGEEPGGRGRCHETERSHLSVSLSKQSAVKVRGSTDRELSLPRAPRARPPRLFPTCDRRRVLLPRPESRKDLLAPARKAKIPPRLPSPSESVAAAASTPPPPLLPPWHPLRVSSSSLSFSHAFPPQQTHPHSSPAGQGNATIGKEPYSQ